MSSAAIRKAKHLLCWKQGRGDDIGKSTELIVKSLVNKLEKQEAGSLEELECALSHTNPQTHCVTIARTFDHSGRMQVAHIRKLPHVLYCRLWRWPDLKNHHELELLENCEFGYSKNKDKVCINPYHYKRVETQHNFNLNSGTVAEQYQKPPIWCSIDYWELDKQVGETFKASLNDVVVDGFINPSTTGSRFCLGVLSSSHRSKTIEDTRCLIGKGVHLNYAIGAVSAVSVGQHPVFVQSKNLNYLNGFLLTTVCKFLPGCSSKIFNKEHFDTLLAQSINQGLDSIMNL
uniref:Mothers against decapentaplegic homolog n=1 Tax=Amphimedon queenslandica TaxID=400682 RepID=A0A1X7UDG0_AMPQE